MSSYIRNVTLQQLSGGALRVVMQTGGHHSKFPKSRDLRCETADAPVVSTFRHIYPWVDTGTSTFIKIAVEHKSSPRENAVLRFCIWRQSKGCFDAIELLMVVYAHRRICRFQTVLPNQHVDAAAKFGNGMGYLKGSLQRGT